MRTAFRVWGCAPDSFARERILSKTTCWRSYGFPSLPCVVLMLAMFCPTTSMRIRSALRAETVLLRPGMISIIYIQYSPPCPPLGERAGVGGLFIAHQVG